MERIDRNRILEHYKDIHELREVVGVYEFAIEECPITLKIKVKQIAPNRYYGLANYGIKGPTSITPYLSMKTQQSAQEALEDALKGFMSSWNPKIKDQLEILPTKEW